MARRVALAVGFLVAACLAGDVSSSAQPVQGVTLRPARPAVPSPPPPRPVPAPPAGTLIAYVRTGRTVVVRSAPKGAVLARLGSRTAFGSPQTLAVTRAGRGLHVIAAELPNGRIGWVDGRGALRLARTAVTLDADLSSRLLRVRAGERLLRTIRIGIGAPRTPTPTGRFAITDELAGSRFSAVYGCCILALSGHQTNLPRGWTGGDRLAIHGGSLGAVSTGCLHAADTDLRWLMRVVPLGAQITIHP